MTPIYYGLAWLAHLLLAPLLALLTFKPRYKQSLKARFFFPRSHRGEHYDFWLHACSLGEVSSLEAIVDSIPTNKKIFISVITQTGFSQAHHLFGARDNVVIDYLPFETLLPLVAPTCDKLLVFEAELWLLLFAWAKRGGASTKLVNARISSRSLGRYLRLKKFYKHLFSFVDSVLCQSEMDLSRLEALGAKNVKTLGNIKILNPIRPSRFYARPARLVVLAASTHAGEEEVILEAFSALLNGKSNAEAKSFKPKNPYSFALPPRWNHIENAPPLLILVPRHPERFEVVYKLAARDFEVARWTSLGGGDEAIENLKQNVLLVDAMGELINLYALSDLVILGGGFAPIGGHNPLEPATFNNILISGKEIFNQKALFDCVRNYYLVSKDELASALLAYKDLSRSMISTWARGGILQAILA